jgi:hypothetical protein
MSGSKMVDKTVKVKTKETFAGPQNAEVKIVIMQK